MWVCVCVCDVVGWQFACGYAQISLLSALKSNAKERGTAHLVSGPVTNKQTSKQINKQTNRQMDGRTDDGQYRISFEKNATACRFVFQSEQLHREREREQLQHIAAIAK